MDHFNRLCVALIACLIVALSHSTWSFAQDNLVKIGFVADFSSVSQAYSNNAFLAAELAVEGFNRGEGLLGRQIQLIKRDAGNDPEKHYQQVIDLVENEGIVAVFGGASSPCVLRASAAALEKNIPYLISIGNSQSIVVEQGHSFAFLFQPNNYMESLGFTIFTTLMPWRRYTWLGPDYEWGHNVLNQFKKNFETIGSPIEWVAEIWHPLGATDFSAHTKAIIDSPPDALVVATWGEDLRYFLNDAQQTRLFEEMAVFGWFSIIPGRSKMIPEGIWKISRGPFLYLAEKYPQTKRFVEEFNSKYQTFPLDFTICCYDSFLAWQKAVETGGSFSPEIVAKTLKGMSFTGLRGNNTIRELDGQMSSPTYFGRITHNSAYPFPITESVIEIPANRTWLSEQEVLHRRGQQ